MKVETVSLGNESVFLYSNGKLVRYVVIKNYGEIKVRGGNKGN